MVPKKVFHIVKYLKLYKIVHNKQLCEKLIRKMSRKRNVPFLSGRMEIWAAAIIHALGSINFLFDPNFEPYIGAADISDYFGTSKVLSHRKQR